MNQYITFDTSLLIAGLELLVSIIAVFFAIGAAIEYFRLNKLRKDLEKYKYDLENRLKSIQKAFQKVISSYAETDILRKISLLQTAVKIYPAVFNGYNALGYAFLEENKITEAIDAFKDAIRFNPTDKEGYFDLAYAYHIHGNDEYCMQYLNEAINIDPSSRNDLYKNELFKKLWEDPRYKNLYK